MLLQHKVDSPGIRISDLCVSWPQQVESPETLGTEERIRRQSVGVASWAPAWVRPPRGQTAPHWGSWREAKTETHWWKTERQRW